MRERQICYFAHNNTFHRVALDGTVLSSTNLLTAGQNGLLQYPLLYLDAAGMLHAAWTTQKHGVYLYWDIHYLQSPDGGESWRTMSGTPVSLPVIADEGGPADRISLDDEFEAHTWLESFFVRAGKAHFLYLAQTEPPRQHYVRYDIAAAERELDVQPEFKGTDPVAAQSRRFFRHAHRGTQRNYLLCFPRRKREPPRLPGERRQRNNLARLCGQPADSQPLFDWRLS